MKRSASSLALCAGLALLLLGCAGTPAQPGGQVEEARLLAAAVPGVATRDSLSAQFGATTRQGFDNGVEVWRYLSPAGGGRFNELVIAFDGAGIVRQIRRRPPHRFDPP